MTIKTILFLFLLTIPVFPQTRQTETLLLAVKDGRVIVKDSSLNSKNLPDRYHLKPGQYLVTREIGVSVEVKEIGPEIEVRSQGFSPEQMKVIELAVKSWNSQLHYRGEGKGQVTIKWKSLAGMQAQTELALVNDTLVSAVVFIDPSTTDLKALQSTVAHEIGHVLQLPDCSKCDSVMRSKSKGRNKTNGFVVPTPGDLASIRLR